MLLFLNASRRLSRRGSVVKSVKSMVRKLNVVSKPLFYLSLFLNASLMTLSVSVVAGFDDDFEYQAQEDDDEHVELAQDYFHVLMDAMSEEDRQAFEFDLEQHQQKMLSRQQCLSKGVKCNSKMAAKDDGEDDDLMSHIPTASDAFKQLDKGLFGEIIDLNTGTVVFNQTDLIAKGNGPDIKISRTLSDQSNPNMNGNLGDWILDIPSIKTTMTFDKGKSNGFWGRGKACSGYIKPDKDATEKRYDGKKSKSEPRKTIFKGDMVPGELLQLPDEQQVTLLKTGNKIYTRKTNSNWRFSCTKTVNHEGEGFVGIDPNGTKYTFNYFITRYNHLPTSPYFIDAYMLVTKIEDRFGNWINYHYNNKSQLEKITASDKRQVTFQYNNNEIETIKYNTRTWKYVYSPYAKEYNSKKHGRTGYHKFRRLKTVTRPDGKAWQYQFNDNAYQHPVGIYRDKHVDNNTLELTVTHPDGAKGTFDFQRRMLGRTNIVDVDVLIDVICPPAGHGGNNPTPCRTIKERLLKQSTPILALKKKTITNELGKDVVWSYAYSKSVGAFFNESLQAKHRLTGDLPSNIDEVHYHWTKVREPDGSQTQLYYNRNGNDVFEGQLMASRVYQHNSLLQETQYSYKKSDKPIGHSGVWLDNWQSRDYRVMQTKKRIERKDESDTYTTEYSGFNVYGVPQISTESNNIGNAQRYTKTTYQHDTDKWVLNLPRQEYVSTNGQYDKPVWEMTYHKDSLLPNQHKKMDVLVETHTHHKGGQLKKITYSGSKRYQTFKDYHRGIPRKITFPCATKNGCSIANGSSKDTMVTKVEVNNDASIKSITDFKGHKTSYTYNAIGWMTHIDHHNKAWANQSISYAKVKNEGDGNDLGTLVQEGQLKQTKLQGSLKEITYFDSLLRPYLFVKQDTKNKLTTYKRTEYDHNNQVVLETNQANSLGALVKTQTDYDALGRVTKIKRLNDNTETTVEYLNGNQKQVTDPNNNLTTTSYLAYGEPEYNKIAEIAAPESTNTSIKYNIYGNMTSIKQGNVTEKRVYDTHKNLCKIVRPETGITAFGYNTQNLPIWRAEGTKGSKTSCDLLAVPKGDKVTLAYDNLDQLKSETYPVNKANQTPNKTYAYDENSNLTKVAAGKVIWDYGYNVMDKLMSEQLNVDKKKFNIAWGYNNLGNVSSLTYPSGKKIDFAPNAFGQATKAGPYASAATYHGNGQVKSFTYGNGMSRSVSLDKSSRINKMQDAHTGKAQLKLTLAYDDNDNLSQIIDGIYGKNSVKNIHYDGLNRLINADGKWGKGQFDYDAVGNIKHRSVSGSKINYVYGNDNRLKSISGAYKYAYKHDARGNTVHNGRYPLIYNEANQLTSAKGHTYVYDGHGKRVKDTQHNATEYSIYSQGGQLLHRQKANGDKIDSIYLGNQLIADVESR